MILVLANVIEPLSGPNGGSWVIVQKCLNWGSEIKYLQEIGGGGPIVFGMFVQARTIGREDGGRAALDQIMRDI